MAPRASIPLADVRPPERRSLTQEVTDQLLKLIASADEPEIGLPPERQLSERLGVSRNVVRESLAALGRLGVVSTRGKTRVGNTSRAQAHIVAGVAAVDAERELLLDPMEVRRILEPEVAALAAGRIDERALLDLEHWLVLMRDGLERGERIVEYDSAFHVAIARASGNDMLARLVGALTDALQASRERSFQPSGAGLTALGDHERILDALRRRAPDEARTAMTEHLDRVETLIRSALAEPQAVNAEG
jgi:GntR family transcriptional regulator, transcriptional repressor for pyruvate dehydrogenase complex